MRVLHLYAGNLFGGIERTLLTLWRARRRAPRMQPHFALCFDAKLADELRQDGAPVEIFGDVRLSRPWTVLRARRRLRASTSRAHFDVALAHGLWPHVVFAPAVREARLPLVTWLHDVPREGGWLEWLAQREPPDVLLANSRYTAARAAEVFAGARIEVQRPPVELPHVPSESSVTKSHRFVILIASRLQRSKGHVILIDALSMLPAALDWECWIAGAPQRASEHAYLEELRHRAAAVHASGRLRFLGHRDDVPRLLAAADVMCQPNTKPEGFGLAYIEAMAVGTPVVTTDIGAARELIDDTCGVLVAPDDPRAVAAAITRIATTRHRCDGRARAREMCCEDVALPRLAGVLERVGAKA
jgi:glycosyltransferase involved in cell wall biosynthesis